MTRTTITIIALGTVLLSFCMVFANCNKDSSGFKTVKEPSFITTDIDLFWEMYDRHLDDISVSKIQRWYINQGSVGLKDYDAQKNLDEALNQALKLSHYQRYYRSVRDNTLDLEVEIATVKKAMERLNDIYAGTRLTDVYFLVGALTAGGRISENGLLIAVEMFSKEMDTSTDQFSRWIQQVTRTKNYLPSIVVHELVHIQQNQQSAKGDINTLLEQSILEGMADYIAHYLLAGQPFMNDHLHAFGDPMEAEIWTAFRAIMDEDYRKSDWLYSGSNTAEGYPADIGYYVGYKIIEAYARSFDSQEKAIISMLEESNYENILTVSGYDG